MPITCSIKCQDEEKSSTVQGRRQLLHRSPVLILFRSFFPPSCCNRISVLRPDNGGITATTTSILRWDQPHSILSLSRSSLFPTPLLLPQRVEASPRIRHQDRPPGRPLHRHQAHQLMHRQPHRGVHNPRSHAV